MVKMIFSMAFLFSVLLVCCNLQDAGQQFAGALLLVVSMALAFVLQLGDAK
jgi:hypothetical protein